MGGDVERRRGENVTAAANANARGVRMNTIRYVNTTLRDGTPCAPGHLTPTTTTTRETGRVFRARGVRRRRGRN